MIFDNPWKCNLTSKALQRYRSLSGALSEGRRLPCDSMILVLWVVTVNCMFSLPSGMPREPRVPEGLRCSHADRPMLRNSLYQGQIHTHTQIEWLAAWLRLRFAPEPCWGAWEASRHESSQNFAATCLQLRELLFWATHGGKGAVHQNCHEATSILT